MENNMRIANECGVFTVDQKGVLTDFCCAKENIIDGKWRCLDIPEGVLVIPEEAFCWCEIVERLTFPQSLQRIGGTDDFCDGVFSHCKLPHVSIPENLQELGTCAFSNSFVASVRIPMGLCSSYRRQFKSSDIGILYLPEVFRSENSHYGFSEKEACFGQMEPHGYIRSLRVNSARIGTVIFE